MGSITAPRPTYVPTLPQAVVVAKTLSDAQLETLIYAGDAFERDIPGLFKPVEEGLSIAPSEDGRPYRTGFFLGDGTGAGKGRQVAAIILDQWLRGRRKHIWVSNFANLQKSGLMKTFTDPFRIPCPLPCGNYGRGGRRRQRLPLRLSMRRIRPTGGRASIRSIPLMSALVAEGADVAPYRLVLDGCAASALPVPGLFSQATACAGYTATRSEDLVDSLRIMIDAIGADRGLRITPAAMVRLCATWQALLDDIATFGLSPTSTVAASVVTSAPDAT